MAAGSTYTPIASQTLGSAAANVTFSSLGSYTDLVLVFNGKCASAGGWNLSFRFNGDTGSNYSTVTLYGDGTSPYSARSTNASQAGNYIISGTNQSTVTANIMNYGNSTNLKSIIGTGGDLTSGGGVDIRVSTWRNTAPITSILLYSNGGDFVTGSTFTLYGITAA
jgi:hypothetical protein